MRACPAHMQRPRAAAPHQAGACRAVRLGRLQALQQQQAPPPQQQQQQQPPPVGASTLQELVARPSTALTAFASFGIIAADVFLPGGDHPALQQLLGPGAAQAAAAADVAAGAGSWLLRLDAALHEAVLASTEPAWRAGVADVLISDAFITAGVAGWLLCTTLGLGAAARWPAGAAARATAPLGLAWLGYVFAAGAVGRGDPPLVAALKQAFGRARPSALHHTYSFPSGHTTAAVFTVGALLVVLLPLTLELLRGERQAAAAAPPPPPQPCQAAAGSPGEAAPAAASGPDVPDSAMLAVWATAWLVTAGGRVLADAHWLSDTLGGGCLAVGCVSLLALACRSLRGHGSSAAADAANKRA